MVYKNTHSLIMNISVPNNYFQIISDLILSSGATLKYYDSETFYEKDDIVLFQGTFYLKVKTYGKASFSNVEILNFTPKYLYNVVESKRFNFNSVPVNNNNVTNNPNIDTSYVIASVHESFFTCRDFVISASLSVPRNMLDSNLFKFGGMVDSVPELSFSFKAKDKSVYIKYGVLSQQIPVPLESCINLVVRNLNGVLDIFVNSVLVTSFFISRALVFCGVLTIGSPNTPSWFLYDLQILPSLSNNECETYNRYLWFKNGGANLTLANFTLYEIFNTVNQSFNTQNSLFGSLELGQSNNSLAPTLNISPGTLSDNTKNSLTLFFKPQTFIYSSISTATLAFYRPLHFIVKMQLNVAPTTTAHLVSFGAFEIMVSGSSPKMSVTCGDGASLDTVDIPVPLNTVFVLDVYLAELGPLDGYNFNSSKSCVRIDKKTMIEKSFGTGNVFDCLTINNNAAKNSQGLDMNVYYFGIFNKRLLNDEIDHVCNQ